MRYFTYRAERTTGDLHEMFRIGHQSLAIGLGVLGACILGTCILGTCILGTCILGACILGGRLVSSIFGASGVSSFFVEAFIIIGWVANWRPLEIFFMIVAILPGAGDYLCAWPP
jgi:hypothetical protein